jgi:aspartyl-tRNA(Asn)/glutamyl-tRNA(Gln) amidotransferase subunit A
VDVLTSPTLPVTATPIGQSRVELDGEEVGLAAQWVRFTSPFNQTGYPASSQPCGFDRHGLPIGLQLVGRPWAEAMVLRVAHTLQAATDWHLQRPPL